MPVVVLKLFPRFHLPLPESDHAPVMIASADSATLAVNAAKNPVVPMIEDITTLPRGLDTAIPVPASIAVGVSTVIVVVVTNLNVRVCVLPAKRVYGLPFVKV